MQKLAFIAFAGIVIILLAFTRQESGMKKLPARKNGKEAVCTDASPLHGNPVRSGSDQY